MDANVTLELKERDVTGKAVKRLRADGLVPAVIHDHGKPSVVVAGQYMPMLKVYQTAGKHHPVQLTAGGKHFTALIKSADFSPKKNELRHVVFNAVRANEKVDAEVPVHPRYAEGNESSPAERAGLIVLQQLESVQVAAMPRNLPEALHYDAEKLAEVGDHATVADLAVPEGVELRAEPTQVVATVFEPSSLAAANEAAGESGGETAVAEAEQETTAESGGQSGEIRPGGKKEAEDNTQAREPSQK